MKLLEHSSRDHFEIGLVSIRSNCNTLVSRIIFQGSQNKQTNSYTYKIDPEDWDAMFFDLFMDRPNAGLSVAPDEPRNFS